MLYLFRWVFLCYSTRKSSLLLLLPPWLSAGFPSVKRGDACLSTPPLVSQRGWPRAASRPGLPASAWPRLSCAVTSLSCLGCLLFLGSPEFCVALFLQRLHRDVSPKGPALGLGHVSRIAPDVCVSFLYQPWALGCCSLGWLLP